MYLSQQLTVLFFQIVALLGCQRLTIPMVFDFLVNIWVLNLHPVNRFLLTNYRLLQRVYLVNKPNDLSKYFFFSIGQDGLSAGYKPSQRVDFTQRGTFVFLGQNIFESRIGPHRHHIVNRCSLVLLSEAIEARLLVFG